MLRLQREVRNKWAGGRSIRKGITLIGLPLSRNARSSIQPITNGIGKDMGIMTSEIFDDKPEKKPKVETRHHPDFSPSSFPAFQVCPCYKSSSGGNSEALDKGNRLHEQLHEILTSHEV